MCRDVPAHFLFYWRCTTISTKELQINDEIEVSEVRLLSSEGEQVGIVDIETARQYAYERDLDLVLIAPVASPPVCKAMDYGKYLYEQNKREKEAKKKQQVFDIKEVQLSPRIQTHDFEIMVARAKRFLSDGNKVRVALKFRGREIYHPELGREMLEKFSEACAEVGFVEKKPNQEGRQLIMFLAPEKK